eukprot:TRINITY_DN5511_c0_g1_i2.p1 TRINITY_DN5511_c0_g1~~TRINITY_DN5511_c0_g1_i2.p1  ORF type:complete len:499 (+),score=121.28 TRINITY_DN5511_c0_g1_i2:135-1631(+)
MSRMSPASLFVVLLLTAVTVLVSSVPTVSADGNNTNNFITSLPGIDFSSIPFAQYSGYINLEPNTSATERNTFYWLVESQSSTPTTDPLIVWYQGGPGCTGLLGLFEENGPFLPTLDGNLTTNQFSWNQFANVLYVESPLGVGFSYGVNNNGSTFNYSTNDTHTADDNYSFLSLFYDQYPQYAERDLWFAGESYAGVYIPTLAYLVLGGHDERLLSNLQGFTIGNPVIACNDTLPSYTTTMSTVQANLFFWHGSVSFDLYTQWTENGCTNSSSPSVCAEISKEMYAQMGPEFFNPDDLYYDQCTANQTLGLIETTPNCNSTNLDNELTAYLNRADVQAAIHANPGTNWQECSNIPYTLTWPNMLNYYNKFFSQANKSLEIMIYSGDVDIATCPHAYSQTCLSQLDRPSLSEWQPWTVNGQLAGYVEVYDKYTFATIKGAGHEAPMFQPFSAHSLIKRFVTGQNITEAPATSHHVRRRRSRPSVKHLWSKMMQQQQQEL